LGIDIAVIELMLCHKLPRHRDLKTNDQTRPSGEIIPIVKFQMHYATVHLVETLKIVVWLWKKDQPDGFKLHFEVLGYVGKEFSNRHILLCVNLEDTMVMICSFFIALVSLWSIGKYCWLFVSVTASKV